MTSPPSLPARLSGSDVYDSIPVNRFHRKRRQAHCDVLRAAFVRSRITHPLAPMSHHRLSRANIQDSSFVLHAYCALEHDREFVELGSLSRLNPSCWAAHVRNAGSGRLRVDAPDVLINQLGLVA